MASPTSEVFFVYHISTGAPLTGAAGSFSFVTYKDDLGNNLTPPTITEIGGGAYKFDITHTPNRGVVYVISTGASGNPGSVARYVRPEDFNTDALPDMQDLIEAIKDYQEGKWRIFTTGPDANRLVIYAPDGTTVLKKYDLLDSAGDPTYTSPFSRIPV